MRTKIIFLAGLIVATMTMQAQTVDYTAASGSGMLSIHHFERHLGRNVYVLLNNALMNQDNENDKLITATFGEDAIITDMVNSFKECERLCGDQMLTTAIMPTTTGNAEVDFSSAFERCFSLTSVKLSATYERAGEAGFYQTFENCSKLTTLDLRAFASVSTYRATFRYCPN